MKPIFKPHHQSQLSESDAQVSALDKSQAVIEFKPDGTIITANENFLGAVGYKLSEIAGKHHSIFVEEAYRNTSEYQEFWRALGDGEFQAAQYKRLGRNGKEVWIEASYNPLVDQKGDVFKVVKYATDISAQKLREADIAGQVAAMNKSQAVIEFELDGTIITANENFLGAVGYSLDEIKGKHHSMFVDEPYRQSDEYRRFWGDLAQGRYQAAQYKRYGKNGKEIWIQASYNPILDMNGRPFKVVKFATDITQQVELLKKLSVLIAEIDRAINTASNKSESVTHVAGNTARNVQSVASASEELAASTKEIAESMAKSKYATDQMFEQAGNATDATGKLSEATQQMGGIVSMIQDIASQINLLALNATIEAARAGEAGRGFAVVAGEVKNLASQAAQATDRITQEIANIQDVSTHVVSALDLINNSVEQVREFVAVTAAAVEEQSAVTQDLSATMQSTADGVDMMSGSVQGISDTVGQIAKSVNATREAAGAFSY